LQKRKETIKLHQFYAKIFKEMFFDIKNNVCSSKLNI